MSGPWELDFAAWRLPRDVSVHGERIDFLMNTTHLFVGLLFVIACVWMGWACLFHGRRHAAVYDAGSTRGAIVSALLVSALVFFIVDGNLFVQTLRGLDEAFWNFEVPRKDPRTVRIQVNAHQWAWEARYAGPDARFGTEDDLLSWNELPVPLGVPISLQLASADVIHNLYLPNFRVKMDAVPGQVNRMWFQAKETGDFEIACAQHCGTSHYKMKGVLRVLPEADYRRWEAEAAVNARRAYDPEDTTAHWAWEWKEPAP